MSTLTVVLVVAMVLWAVGFVVIGLVLAEEVLWRRPAGKGSPAISETRKVAAIVLLLIGGILVVTAIGTGVLVADRESRLVRLEGSVSRLESTVHALESKLNLGLSNSPQSPAAPR